MRIKYLKIEQFKNLKDFELNLQSNSNDIFVTVGKNGTGKSNLLEALVLIFRNLFLYEKQNIAQIQENSKYPLFDFVMEYECNEHFVKVELKKKPTDEPDLFSVKEETLVDFAEREYLFFTKEGSRYISRNKKFFYAKNTQNNYEYLPKYVFAYYSGISNRLEEHFDYHQNQFYKALLKGEDNPFRPLFYARPIHSNFVLLAFYAFKQDKIISEFLQKLNIVGLESTLFVIRKPNWNSPKGDIRFWNAKGVVANFLDKLFEESFLPIKHKIEVRTDFRHSKDEECWYLFLKDEASLKQLAQHYKKEGAEDEANTIEFFKALESTYISDLIHETRIKVKRRDSNNNITFKELSEGEQQLLTVLGLLKFTNSEQSLFLLDEPDTHLSPIWGHDYLKMLKTVSGDVKNSQMFISTHKSTTVSGLEKEQILVFSFDENGKAIWDYPEMDAKGLTSDGVLTQIFDMEYTYDEGTWKKMLDRRRLFAKKMFDEANFTKEEADKLAELTSELSDYAGNYADGLFYEFVHELDKSGGLEAYRKITLTDDEKKQRREDAEKLLAKLRQKRNNS
jgi:predicted ATPase